MAGGWLPDSGWGGGSQESQGCSEWEGPRAHLPRDLLGGSRGTKDWVLAMGCRVSHLPWPMAFWWMKVFCEGKGRPGRCRWGPFMSVSHEQVLRSASPTRPPV